MGRSVAWSRTGSGAGRDRTQPQGQRVLAERTQRKEGLDILAERTQLEAESETWQNEPNRPKEAELRFWQNEPKISSR